MSSMIKDAVISIINNNLEEHGIVIWYDPDEIYKDIVNKINFEEISIIIFDGSYYDVRFKAEEYFDGLDKNNLLIYINKERDVKNYPLVELEAPGCVCSPVSTLKYKTDFSTLVKKVLKGQVQSKLLEELCKKIEEKNISLNEVEKLIEDNVGITVLSTIFGKNDPKDIILLFLCNKELDAKIEKKNSFSDVKSFLEGYLDINLNNVNRLEELRKKVAEIILLSDFVNSTNSKKITEKYITLKLPSNKDIKFRIEEIAKKWRESHIFSDMYISMAEKVQNKYKISDGLSEIEKIIDCETFKIIDEKILKNLLKKIEKIDKKEIDEIIFKRKKAFWIKNIPEYFLVLQIIKYYIEFRTLIEKANKIITREESSLKDFINLYVGEEDNQSWFLIDRYFRLIESKLSELDFGGDFDEDMDYLIVNCRHLYSKFLNKQIGKFILKFKDGGLNNNKVLFQRDIYRKKVLPFIEEGKKCAYLLIDALRYEMGVDLFELLKDSKERHISYAFAKIPTATPFGMLSLMLGPDDDVDIEAGEEDYFLTAGKIKISSRRDRLKYLEKKNLFYKEIFKLEQIIKPKKSIRNKLKNFDFIIVTSQEIDSIMEEGNDILAKNLMDKVFIQIQRAINSLSELGFEIFILSADHGFLLGSGIGKEHKVDVPNGKTFDLHKRYWVGMGGDNPENTIRFKASDIGYSGNLDFVFPIGVSIFKTPGQENDYFHGGISLQELIIPVIEIHKEPKEKKETSSDREYKIVFNKAIITNRIFLIKISEEEKQLTLESESNETKKKVSLKVISEGKDFGQVIAAEYGFIDSTKEIILELNKSNAVTIKLNEELTNGFLNIILIDSETELELVKISELEFKLSI